jgi:GDP-4-dehydro-6-deoxy-D-mannose reductase
LRKVVAEVSPGAIYHLAAMTHVGESWENPSEVLRVNVLGTAEILAAARTLAAPPTVLVVSSAEVYGTVSPEQLPLREDAPTAPATPYAASKLAAEAVALQAWRGYGQPVIVVRPFNHIGPGQSPNFAVPALAKRIVEARRAGADTLRVGTLTTRRDFTDVRDVVVAYRLLLLHGRVGTVYNVCSGRDVAISEVADELLALAHAELELVTDPDLVRPVDVPVLRGDAGLLQAATGWSPTIPLATTLADVLTSWEAG